jgi:hypothetical protein
MAEPVQSIAEVIRLAVAPVFLFSGIGIVLTVLTNRLARIVDRARKIEAEALVAAESELDDVRRELGVLERRARLLNMAVTLLVVSALLVSGVVISLFFASIMEYALSRLIATLFILTMLSFVGAMLCFLREVRVATAALRIGLRLARTRRQGQRP